MVKGTRKGMIVASVMLAVLLFSLFLKIDAIFGTMNALAERGWSLLPIILVATLIRTIFAGIVVLIVLPLIMGFKRRRDWLSEYLRLDSRTVRLGVLSFVGFAFLATAISLCMGIFKGDLTTVFAFPDIRPDQDVVGWGYFLLALVPGIWEELAFRGLIQSRTRQAFSTPVSVLLSSLFFGLYHFSNMVTQAPSQVVPGVIMAVFFGIGWGFMMVKARSVVPAMISHYLVDALGQVFLNVDGTDPALATGFFVLLTLLFPVFNIILTKMMYKDRVLKIQAAQA